MFGYVSLVQSVAYHQAAPLGIEAANASGLLDDHRSGREVGQELFFQGLRRNERS